MVRRSAFCIAMAALVAVSFAHVALAQVTSPGIGPPSADPRSPVQRPDRRPRHAPAPRPVALDRVVAVVNNEAVTQFDVNEQKRLVMAQMRDAKVSPPPPDALERQVLERLVTERAMLQFAKETGIRVDDQMVERTILRIAQENKLSVDDFRRLLEREKIPVRQVSRGHPEGSHDPAHTREGSRQPRDGVGGRAGRVSRHGGVAGGRRNGIPDLPRPRLGPGTGLA